VRRLGGDVGEDLADLASCSDVRRPINGNGNGLDQRRRAAYRRCRRWIDRISWRGIARCRPSADRLGGITWRWIAQRDTARRRRRHWWRATRDMAGITIRCAGRDGAVEDNTTGLVELAQNVVHRDHVALCASADCEHTRLERRHLDRDLVGLEFHQGLTRDDGIALLLQPA